MPSIAGLLRFPLIQFIYLKRKFFYFISGRRRRIRDEEWNVGFTSAGSCATTHTVNVVNVLDDRHLPFRPTPPPLNSPIQSCKRKALLIGVDDKLTNGDLRSLKGSPHKDIWAMRKFLIGGYSFIVYNISNS